MRVRTIGCLAILYVGFLSWGCREKIIVYPPPKVPEVSLPRTGEDAETKADPLGGMKFSQPFRFPPMPAELVNADVYFGLGEYPEAIREYEAYTAKNPDDANVDRALLNIGLSHALASGSDRNLQGAKSSLNRLIKKFPGSRYRGEASLILDLIAQVERLDRNMRARTAQIKRLEDELQRLKEIDLKRRPPRPAE